MTDPTAHVARATGEIERWTPAHLLAAAREFYGEIDLDPASCEAANEVVGAARYFDAAADGLAQDWTCRTLWLNPPYSSGLMPRFIAKLAAEVGRGHVGVGLVLTNNATETRWAQALFGLSWAVCFLTPRLRFYSPTGGNTAGALQGQALWHVGLLPLRTRFDSVFLPMGAVVRPRHE